MMRNHANAFAIMLVAAACSLAGCAAQDSRAQADARSDSQVKHQGQHPSEAHDSTENEPPCCKPTASQSEAADLTILDPASLPDVELLNQDGKKIRFYDDLVRGKVAVVNFFFTSCTTSCPVMGTNFAELQKLLPEHIGQDLALISVSVDPVQDTPERLKAWGERFQAGPGWTMVTGEKQDVDRLLKALKSFSADKRNHPSMVLVIDGTSGAMRRASGLASPTKLVDVVRSVLEARANGPAAQAEAAQNRSAPPDSAAAQNYFTDTILIDQDGRPRRFYSDLIKGKVVVINVFFTTCKGSCLVMSNTQSHLQERFADRLGKDLHLISISVDPLTDTPEKLQEYAVAYQAKPGRFLLTGDKKNVDAVLRKLGQYVENRESHTSIMIVGNEPTGLWKKAFGLSKPEEIATLVEGVLNDGNL